MSYHVDVIPNRKSPPAILFRRAWREGKKIRRETISNLTGMPAYIIDGIRAMLKGGVVYKDIKEAFPIKRSCPTATWRPCTAPRRTSVLISCCTERVPGSGHSPRGHSDKGAVPRFKVSHLPYAVCGNCHNERGMHNGAGRG